jgi:hypothetical protein
MLIATSYVDTHGHGRTATDKDSTAIAVAPLAL